MARRSTPADFVASLFYVTDEPYEANRALATLFDVFSRLLQSWAFGWAIRSFESNL